MNKGKILKITENTVYIGYEDGSLKEISIESCDFEPRMGDYVEVYGDIAIKVEGSNESSPVKKHKSRKSKIKPLLIALVVIVLSVSAYFIINKVITSQNISSSSKSSMSSSKNSSSSSSQESSSSSTKSRTIPSVEYKDVDMDKTKYKPLTSYDEWVHDELPRYMKIRIRGEVGQVADDPGGIIVRLILTELGENYGKIVSILIPTKYISRTIVYGDTLTFYGETNGTGNYQYQEGFITLPIMIAYMYEN
ncbi:hypothetical protein [Streptococcus mitis]|uniref:hypothetical protein n=1 Tax=Streptococcus mitis TaxID=28037 RepID=UPI00066E7ADB|nr:hypothetical protein [Streptococcus mitis]